ncbi:hypothetical protein KSP40_PGU004896 [Platanthera guangdongensis]|uniref:Uncharacterized protein n=1 Tax=Platanthera guangdongensis TaxID=2320717 RepID=A0ABR2LM14_9ASPA
MAQDDWVTDDLTIRLLPPLALSSECMHNMPRVDDRVSKDVIVTDNAANAAAVAGLKYLVPEPGGLLFLSNGEEDGNMALKDSTETKRWAVKNVKEDLVLFMDKSCYGSLNKMSSVEGVHKSYSLCMNNSGTHKMFLFSLTISSMQKKKRLASRSPSRRQTPYLVAQRGADSTCPPIGGRLASSHQHWRPAHSIRQKVEDSSHPMAKVDTQSAIYHADSIRSPPEASPASHYRLLPAGSFGAAGGDWGGRRRAAARTGGGRTLQRDEMITLMFPDPLLSSPNFDLLSSPSPQHTPQHSPIQDILPDL